MVNPMYCNNNDSTYFQKDEKENTVLAYFNKENNKQKEKLGLLQNFYSIMTIYNQSFISKE